MEAHSLSPQYLLVADDSHSSQIPSVGREGDFATASAPNGVTAPKATFSRCAIVCPGCGTTR
jgi:hypothetical protein